MIRHGMQQNFKMLPQRNGLSLQSQLRPLSVLVFHLLLTHSVSVQSHLIGPSQPIVATVGDGIILPCHLEPAVDVAAMTLLWTRSDLDPEFVFVRRAGQDLVHTKHPSYKGRTSLFTDELKRGNISLKLSDVRPSDAGRYRCFIPDMLTGSFIELLVGAASSPVISLAGIDRDKGGVVLQCESAGWYPEPEVLWLDGEGKLLSAGPTETVRGPDDLYTVSSRVTVEKRHSNSFTCRVQQRNINQTRETHIQVPDDFFKVQSSSSSTITALAVSLAVCILLILLLVFFVCKLRRNNRTKTKRSPSDEGGGEEMKRLKRKEEKKSKHWKPVSRQKFLEEQRRREEAENKVTHLEQLEKQLQDEKDSRMNSAEEVKTLKQQLQNKNTELDTKTSEWRKLQTELQEENTKLEKEVTTLKQDIKIKDTQLQLQTQLKVTAQSEVKDLKNQLETKIKELEKSMNVVAQTKHQLEAIISKWTDLHKKLEKELQGEKDSWKKFGDIVTTLKQQLQNMSTQLQDEHARREEAGRQVQMMEQELHKKTQEMERKQAETIKQLQQRKEEAQKVVQTLNHQLESQKTEVSDQYSGIGRGSGSSVGRTRSAGSWQSPYNYKY